MVRALICGTVLAVALAFTTSLAGAQPTQSSGLQSDAAFGTAAAGDPAANMDTALALGARSVRVFVIWKESAPSPSSCTAPAASVLDDPNAYDFSRAATIMNNAHNRGIAIYLAFGGPFPCYGSLEPSRCTANPTNCTWRPNAQLYRKMVHAFAVRYGHLINRWSPYNEPDNPNFLAQTNASGQRTAPVIYRSLWFNARNEIRASTTTGAPIFFADVSGFPTSWVQDALCFTAVSSNDPAYPSCTSAPHAVDAEAIAFHPYLNDKPDTPTNKNLPQIQAAGTTLEAAQSRGLITTPSYTTITESGVHYGACYTNANVGGQQHCDPHNAGQVVGDLAASERRQAAWMNCVEENAYKDRHVTSITQYLLQDGPARNPDDVWYTGLRHEANNGQVGTDKPALAAWRMPFTVKRLSDGRLEVWGAYRLRPAPASLTVVAVTAGGVAYQRTVSTAAQGYFDAFFTDAPTGYSWQVRAANGLASRVANGTDCN
jgi:hypothetical protein